MNSSRSAKARKELLDNLRNKYQPSDWATKNKLLDGFVIAISYERKYACRLLNSKSGDDVILGLDTATQLLPFSILGCDVDNGSEFINDDVLDYCKKNKITYTCSRAYKKNDQASVEEKNGSIVRRLIGYDRYGTEEAWEAMCQLYAVLRLYINFYQPTLKLLEKKRVGSRTIKKYEKAKTPYQRVLESKHIPQDVKNNLIKQYNNLDPIVLKAQIKILQDQLWKHAWTGPIISAIDELEVNMESSSELKSNEPRRYRKTKKPSRKRDWRTRKDPFEDVREFIDLELQLNANVFAKEILEKLMKKHPIIFIKVI